MDPTASGLEIQVHEWLRDSSFEMPVVVVPVFNAYEDVLECLESLKIGTRADVRVLILDDASTDERIPASLSLLTARDRFLYVRKPHNEGFVKTANLAFHLCASRDVIIVNSDVVVPSGWLERLQAAAYYRSNIATATPFTNHGTIVSVPYRNQPVPTLVPDMSTTEIDNRICSSSLRLRPVIPTAIGHCTYFRRQALDLVGYLDESLSPGYGEEVDFSQRAISVGLSHVLADDVFVYHKGSRSFGQDETKQAIREAHERVVNTRYPWYHEWVIDAQSSSTSPLALAIERARAALLGYRIAIDATRVDGTTTGTQVQTLELIRALAKLPSRSGQLAVIIEDSIPQEILLGVEQLVDQVIRISELKGSQQSPYDLIHRPFQIRSAKDLIFLQKAATRFVISQLDCISYSNPSYAETPRQWASYRYLTELAFAVADGIVYISNDVAADTEHQGLHIPRERTCIAHIGVDHHLHSAVSSPPVAAREWKGEPYLLMIGTSFRHKNRPWVLKLFAVLVEKYRWTGKLVFAGPTPTLGGSEEEEKRELEHQPAIHAQVCYLGTVNEPEKQWLLRNAALVLYPSNYEGFGLVPFEAAAAGVPCLTTRSTSLEEVLGEQVVYLETLDPEEAAEMVWRFLSDPQVAERQVEAIQARASAFTWDRVAERVWSFYCSILQMPPRSRELTRGLKAEEEANRIKRLLGMLASARRVWRTQGGRVVMLKAWRYLHNGLGF